jgi:DNA repair exonuclease SbcCD ATPase subunit
METELINVVVGTVGLMGAVGFVIKIFAVLLERQSRQMLIVIEQERKGHLERIENLEAKVEKLQQELTNVAGEKARLERELEGKSRLLAEAYAEKLKLSETLSTLTAKIESYQDIFSRLHVSERIAEI